MPLLSISAFAPLDWGVFGAYFLLLAATGFALSMRKQTGTDDYFLARHGMPAWAVTCSIVATSLSAATFIGAPEISYNGDLSYLIFYIGMMLAALVVAVAFIPMFYKYKVTTVYQLIEHRAGPQARQAASWMFMIGRIFASGSRIFIAAIPASLILFDNPQPAEMVISILALAFVGVAYTLVGGIRSVIWSDVIQLAVFVVGAFAALAVLLDRIPIGTLEIVQLLQQAGPENSSKLNVIHTGITPASATQGAGVDWGDDYTLITAFTGLIIFNIAAYATDQDLAQRMLTCRSAKKAAWSAIASVLLNLPITLIFLAVGLLLFIFYKRPDVMGDAATEYELVSSQKVFANFILRELPVGLKGLLMAGLFAAGLSSLNSALNAMSSTFVSDFYRSFLPDRNERHYLRVGRIAVVVWGVILAGFAVLCVYWQNAMGGDLITFALSVMSYAYSGLAAVFFTIIFTRRGNTWSVILALLAGFIIVICLDFQPWADAESKFKIAFPWRTLIGATVAFAICLCGVPNTRFSPPQVSDEPKAADLS